MSPSVPENSIAAQVWLVALPPRVDVDVMTACLALLDDDERTRAARFLAEPAREAFVVAHAVARTMLSAYAPPSPGEWAFGRGQFGKPFVARPTDGGRSLRFNLSHTRGLVACAVSTAAEVGVDVEACDRPVAIGDFAKALSPGEADELGRLEPAARRQRFFDIWTAKEAYVKGLGTGVSSALPTITIRDAGGRTPRVAGDTSTWRLRRVHADAHHTAAVAVAASGDVAVRTFTPGQWADCLTR